MNDIMCTMTDFASHIKSLLKDNLRSVILFGSAVLGDFTPGKGDLDFITVVYRDITENDCENLYELHDKMRAGEMGQLAIQIEGTYYPTSITINPRNATGSGCYIGTGRKGWRKIDRCQNSLMDFAVINRFGKVCYGEDKIGLFYTPSYSELLAEINQNLQINIDTATSTDDIEYSISMFHYGARALCYALTQNILSKTEASRWYARTYTDDHWTPYVLNAMQFRHPLSEDDYKHLNSHIVSSTSDFLQYILETIIKGCIYETNDRSSTKD